MSLSARLETVLHRTESATSLDQLADRVARVLRIGIRPGPIEDTLSGTKIGHPAHPAIVAVPVGAWVATTMLDLVDADSRATSTVQALGILSAIPAAATGASDWLSTAGAERRVGLVHASANYLALGLHATSWYLRRRDMPAAARTLGFVGTAAVGLGGWLGGHLAYALGVGVDTTAFQKLPTEWVDAIADAEVPAAGLIRADIEGVPVLFTRCDRDVVAYAARCTHRGGPLDEGTVEDGVVTCPWHGGAFDLSNGAVVSGPATRPQPKLEVTRRGTRIFVRRKEIRALRTNIIGH